MMRINGVKNQIDVKQLSAKISAAKAEDGIAVSFAKLCVKKPDLTFIEQEAIQIVNSLDGKYEIPSFK